jgi:hypothetical protein
LVIVLLILGALAAVAIAVAFDSPTSVILLAALAAGFALLSVYSSRCGRR